MNDYEMLRKALVMAYHAHSGQKAKDKELPEYIFHPVTVALQCTTAEEKTAALLHDVIEDTDVTADDLRRQGFGEDIITAVELLSCPYEHPSPEQYLSYVAEIGKNPSARAVKIADLTNNLDASRLPDPEMMSYKRENYYLPALALLKEKKTAGD